MRLIGKVVVITGASMGIGEAVAKLCAAEGANVVLSSRDLERTESARQRIGNTERTLAVACDVCDRTQIEKLLQATLARFGRVDVWVNNAGFGLADSIEKMYMAVCRRMFDTNLFGAIDAIQVVAPVMREQGGGCIINVSSVAGSIAVPYSAAYGATKHALNCVSRAAHLELQGSGVQVMNVCPGYVSSEFAANLVRGNQSRKFGGGNKHGVSSEYVAEAMLRGYLTGKREIVVPWYYRPVIWLYRIIQGPLEQFMLSKVRPVE